MQETVSLALAQCYAGNSDLVTVSLVLAQCYAGNSDLVTVSLALAQCYAGNSDLYTLSLALAQTQTCHLISRNNKPQLQKHAFSRVERGQQRETLSETDLT